MLDHRIAERYLNIVSSQVGGGPTAEERERVQKMKKLIAKLTELIRNITEKLDRTNSWSRAYAKGVMCRFRMRGHSVWSS